MFFRREVVDTVAWAGDPHKPVTIGPLGERLTPRKSFDLWREEVRRQSKPWTRGELVTADAIRINMQETVLRLSELTEAERRRADEGMRLLNAELNHRVKNILALVRSLVTRGRSDATSLSDFARTLEGRIASLAYAHDQIMAPRGHADLKNLIEAELAPYRLARGDRLNISGPHLIVNARAYPVLALVFHEMATNASKYGALSSDAGELAVSWSLDPAGNCVLEWIEAGGPLVRAPAREGLGTTIVQRNLPHELGGEARVAYELDGVRARFVVPARHIEAVPVDSDAPAAGDDGVRPAAGLLVGHSVLLVEDQLMIALDAEAMLLDHGAAHVEVCGNTAEALRAISAAQPDVAVLDVNLGTGTSFQIAEELESRGVPLVFATGYVDGTAIPERWRNVPRVGKPYNDADMMRALSTVFGLR